MEKQIETKFFEIRDRATCMPAIGVKMSHEGRNESEKFLLSTAGFGDEGDPLIELVFIEINKCGYSSFSWGDRTRSVAHKYIEENFDNLESGSVVDVEFILGETDKPKESDRFDPWTI